MIASSLAECGNEAIQLRQAIGALFGDTTADFGPYHPNTTPAYDIDGDPSNFSDVELENIHKIWMGVACFKRWR